MTATVAELVSVRSQAADAIASYYECLINKVDRTPWHRAGEVIRLSTVAIPVRVLKEDARGDFDPITAVRTDKNRNELPGQRAVDPEIAALYEEPVRRRKEALWEHERHNIRRAVVLGAPGGGKTFLTQSASIALAIEGQRSLNNLTSPLDELPCPVCLGLEDLAKDGLPTDLADAFIVLLADRHGVSAQLETWLRKCLPTAKCWLILDAFDQVKATHLNRLSQRLAAIESGRWKCRVLLTCRTANYNRGLIPWGAVTEYELAPFQFRELNKLVDQWYSSHDPRGQKLKATLNGHYSLSRACSNPLLATLTCLANERREVTAQTSRRDLYHQVLSGLLENVWKTGSAPSRARVDDVVNLLRRIAWILFADSLGANRFPNSRVKEAIAEANTRNDVSGSPVDIRDDLLNRGILIESGEWTDGCAQLSFLHRTFLEYLAAEHLTRAVLKEGWQTATVEWKPGTRARVSTLVAKMSWLPEWRETVILIAEGLAASPDGNAENLIDGLMRLLVDKEKDDFFHHRACHAALCLASLPDTVRRQKKCQAWADRVAAHVIRACWRCALSGVYTSPCVTNVQTPRSLPRLLPALYALVRQSSKIANDSVFLWILSRMKSRRKRWHFAAMMLLDGIVDGSLPKEAISQLSNCLERDTMKIFARIVSGNPNSPAAARAASFVSDYAWVPPYYSSDTFAAVLRFVRDCDHPAVFSAMATVIHNKLRGGLGGPVWGDVFEAVSVLGGRVCNEEVIDALKSAASDSNHQYLSARAREALYAAGHGDIDEAIESYAFLLRTTNGELTIRNIVNAIVHSRRPSDRSKLLDALGRWLRMSAARDAVLDIIAQVGPTAAVESVLDGLATTIVIELTDRTMFHLAKAVQTLGSSALGQRFCDKLITLVATTVGKSREFGIKMLGHAGLDLPPEGILAIQEMLHHESADQRERGAALSGVATVPGGKIVTMRLISLLKDPVSKVRQAAADSLAARLSVSWVPEVGEELARFLREDKWETRYHVMHVVKQIGGKIPDPNIIEALCERAKKVNEWDAREIVDSFGIRVFKKGFMRWYLSTPCRSLPAR